MMGSQERSRKKIHTWKKSTFHFLLCFVMGFFTGFTPTTKAWRSSTSSHFAIPPSTNSPHSLHVLNHSSKMEIEQPNHEKLVIIISPVSKRNKASNVLLLRLANTLRLVSQPLLWVVVEQKPHDPEVSEILRKTGIMYRHIASDEEFGDEDSETDHQRNLAISHIEHHRLSGVVHFAGLSNVYDLTFFQEIRAIEALGAWPIAKMEANERKVTIQGPVCDSSEVMGWHLKKMKNLTVEIPPIHISSFAFNSSILWDPERWGRTVPTQETTQNSLGYVKKEVVEGEAKLKGIPMEGCSKVLLWDLQVYY